MANSENGMGSEEELLRKLTPPIAILDRQPGFIRKTLSVALRLAIWYTLFTAFFRCPSNLTELTPHSPQVCKPYLVVRSHLEPHVAPYYHAYGEPYVDIVRPYAQTFRDQVYFPVANVSSKAYHTYGAPRIAQGSSFAERQWDTLVSPQLRSIKSSLDGLYDSSLEPHVQRVKSIVAPQYELASSQMSRIRDDYLIPAHARSRPIIDKFCVSVQQFLVKVAMPYTCKAWSNLVLLVNGTLRPRIASLYFENVEPQLVRIGAKLASYREGRKLKRLQEEVGSLAETLRPTTTLPPPTISAKAPTTAETTGSVVKDEVSTTSSTSRSRETAQVRIAADLKEWQEKFAIAADNGYDELDKEVANIVTNLQKSGTIKTGEKIVSELETVSQKELEKLQTAISDIVHALPEDASVEEEKAARDALVQALRSAGITIREQAHALRKWFNEYDTELVLRVTAVVEATLDVLDNIRDLGLQEIGMRWAWMDGVTYKDWAKYHALKKQFSEWHAEVNNVGMQHEAFLEARALGDDILSRGMEIAEKTAKQLSALKEVGTWKIRAGDTSDNFDVSVIDQAKVRIRTKAAVATEPSVMPSAAADSSPETPTLVAGSSIESQQTPSQQSSAPATEKLGSSILSEASSLVSEALDQAQTASESAKSYVSSQVFSVPEAAQEVIKEKIHTAYSESISSAASSLSQRVQGSTEETSSSAQPTSVTESLSVSASVLPVKLVNIEENEENIRNDKHDHDNPAALAEDEEAALSIVASSKLSEGTSHPSATADTPPQASVDDTESDLDESHSSSTANERPTTSAAPVEDFKRILSSANFELRSLVDSVSIGVRASSIDHDSAHSILDEADARLESAASAAQSALSHAVYGSSLPTDVPSPETGEEGPNQKVLRSAVEQLDAFSTIVDVYLQQVRNEWDEEKGPSPDFAAASSLAQPTATSDVTRDEL